MLPLTVTTPQDEKDLSDLLVFMGEQPQYYPNHRDWVHGKCKLRMESGRYKAITAVSDGMIVGNAVYDFIDENNVEIKNFRIDEKYQNRSLGRFLLKQVEVETNEKDTYLDVSVDNYPAVEFFILNGFKIDARENLYAANQPEYLMKRVIR